MINLFRNVIWLNVLNLHYTGGKDQASWKTYSMARKIEIVTFKNIIRGKLSLVFYKSQ